MFRVKLCKPKLSTRPQLKINNKHVRRNSFGGEVGSDDAAAGSPVAGADAAAEHNNKNTNVNNPAASSVVSSVYGEIIF